MCLCGPLDSILSWLADKIELAFIMACTSTPIFAALAELKILGLPWEENDRYVSQSLTDSYNIYSDR